MTGAEYLVQSLEERGVTDAFGIPGGVILELIYSFAKSTKLTPHLCYHEQSAGFAAVGYAQASGKLGVAYATRGPGFTNLVTSIADAYCDSVPVLFVTSHVSPSLDNTVRLRVNQEIDSCSMVKHVTKFASRIDSVEAFQTTVDTAITIAQEGRKGPVFLDVASRLWKQEIPLTEICKKEKKPTRVTPLVDTVKEVLEQSERPILLIGDGVNQAGKARGLQELVSRLRVPVLSSRYGHNIIAKCPIYYGYIGGFGLRHANYILSKADAIISLGNRLNFPLNSETYKNIPYQAKIVRIDVDDSELAREIPNSSIHHINLDEAIPALKEITINKTFDSWRKACDEIRDLLSDCDQTPIIKTLESIITQIPKDSSIVCDVGNHEFWVSRVCARCKREGIILYSKSFATLGSAMVKSIGAYYSTGKPVFCFIGDQGFQMNSQELQFISQNNLPITVVILNNHISGMIRDKEKSGYDGKYIHSTYESGYQIPTFEKLAGAYSIDFVELTCEEDIKECISDRARIINLLVDENEPLIPFLPRGNAPYDMMPGLNNELKTYINAL